MSFPRYPEYKYSGVEWLGEVPAHWEPKALRALARPGIDTFIDGDWIEAPYITDDGVRLIQTGNIGVGHYKEQGFRFVSEETFRALRCTEVEPGNVLICRLADPVGRACIAPDLGAKAITSVDVAILKLATDHDAGFVVYLLSSAQYLGYLEGQCRGGTRDRVARSFLGAIRLPIPLAAEQTAIATFLDRETGKIDALVAEQEKLIALLKEKRQAVISHAVTKGLNPDAPMKPSGIEWLGDVPAHWEVRALRTLSSVVRGASPRPAGDPEFFDGDHIPWVTVAEITKDEMKDLTSVDEYLTAAGMDRSRVFKSGTVIYSNSGATLGVPKILKFDACANDGVVGFEELDGRLSPDFIYQFLAALTPTIREEVKQGSGQPNLNTDIVKAIRIALPPMQEQADVCGYIEATENRFSALTLEAERAITLLKERRSALISAAVTGQIDVRGIFTRVD
ncbi:restriction endonuclease subunit S [Panacagrimonas sp.]|uniref:restriction endonuclease subunit S n=1 Tax=Panacagrimonas sp. TaxID=2480088 RepID=UPI003B519BCB